MPKVSIIIPVYNSENYLKESVQTVLNQTLRDFEIILVDDQSTDNSPAICDELCQIDSRVTVIHLEKNKGICGARNEGLKVAKGEYIGFCDNDDFFESTLLEDNYKMAKNYNADLVKFGRKLVDMNDQGEILREKESPISQSSYYESKESMLENFFKIKEVGVLTNVWNGLYKRTLIIENSLFFDEDMRFGSEDADFSYRFFQIANDLAVNSKSYYIHFRRNDFSTSRKFSRNKINSMIKAAKTESPIWELVPNTLDNKMNIVLSKNNHVINVMMYQGLHDNSELSYSERIKLLRRMRELDHLNYELPGKVSRYILKNKPKQWLVTKLYSLKLYHVLYWVLFLENKVKGEKW